MDGFVETRAERSSLPWSQRALDFKRIFFCSLDIHFVMENSKVSARNPDIKAAHLAGQFIVKLSKLLFCSVAPARSRPNQR